VFDAEPDDWHRDDKPGPGTGQPDVEKLAAIRAVAEEAHKVGNHAFVYIAGLECITANAEGTGLLMSHCRKMEAFLYISSLCVYKTPGLATRPY